MDIAENMLKQHVTGIRIVSNLHREVYQRDDDDDSADEFTEISKRLEIQEELLSRYPLGG